MCCMQLSENTGRKMCAIAQPCRTISSQLRRVSTIGKNLLHSNTTCTCPHNMVNFGPLAAEICWRIWGTPANFNGFRVLAALLHGTLVVGVIQTLRCWTEGAAYIWQGGHHVGHWRTFLVIYYCSSSSFPLSSLPIIIIVSCNVLLLILSSCSVAYISGML